MMIPLPRNTSFFQPGKSVLVTSASSKAGTSAIMNNSTAQVANTTAAATARKICGSNAGRPGHKPSTAITINTPMLAGSCSPGDRFATATPKPPARSAATGRPTSTPPNRLGRRATRAATDAMRAGSKRWEMAGACNRYSPYRRARLRARNGETPKRLKAPRPSRMLADAAPLVRCKLPGNLSRLALRVAEVSGDGDHRFAHRRSQQTLGVGL